MSVSAKPPGDPEIAELELRLGAIDWLARCGRELPALAAAGLAAETVGSNVTWNLQAAFLELHFARHRPPRFFGELVRVYEAGHLPCGWQGAWPSGSLIVW